MIIYAGHNLHGAWGLDFLRRALRFKKAKTLLKVHKPNHENVSTVSV